RVIQEVVVDRAVEDYDPDVLIGLDRVNDVLKLPDHFRAHDVDRRIIDSDPPIRGGAPGKGRLRSLLRSARGCDRICFRSGSGRCVYSCHDFSFDWLSTPKLSFHSGPTGRG